MKKSILAAAVVAVSMSLCACGGEQKPSANDSANVAVDSLGTDTAGAAVKAEAVPEEDAPNGVATSETDPTISAAPER